jgi:ankyrin repeat protein
LQDYNCYKPYQGTALIAAAHLGHDDVVRKLIAAKAPLDHVNNLGWTAVIESIVLGDGGTRHVALRSRHWSMRAPTSISSTGRVPRRSRHKEARIQGDRQDS